MKLLNSTKTESRWNYGNRTALRLYMRESKLSLWECNVGYNLKINRWFFEKYLLNQKSFKRILYLNSKLFPLLISIKTNIGIFALRSLTNPGTLFNNWLCLVERNPLDSFCWSTKYYLVSKLFDLCGSVCLCVKRHSFD